MLGPGGLGLPGLAGFELGGGAFEIEFQEAFEDLVVGEVGREAVGGGNGGIEFLVSEIEPCRALVVEC